MKLIDTTLDVAATVTGWTLAASVTAASVALYPFSLAIAVAMAPSAHATMRAIEDVSIALGESRARNTRSTSKEPAA